MYLTALLRYFAGFLIILFISNLSAQQDSLTNLTKTLKKDSNLVLTWYELGKHYLKVNKLDDAKEALEKANELAQETGYKNGEAASLQVLGNYYMMLDKDSLAYLYYEQSLIIASRIKRPVLVGANLNQMASIYANKGRYMEALTMYKKAFAIFSVSKDSTRMPSTLLNLANLYLRMEDSEKALETLGKAEKLAKQLKNNPYTSHIFMTIGNVLMDEGYKTEAMGYFNECIKNARSSNDPYMEAIALSNIASMEDDFGASLKLHLQSIEVFKKLNSKSQVARVTLNIGELFLKYNKDKEAVLHLKKAESLLQEIEDNYGLCLVHFTLANAFLKLGQTGAANEFALKSLSEAKELKLLKYQSDAYGILYNLNLKKGSLKEALSALQKQMSLKDSLNAEKNTNALNNFKTRLDLEKQEEQIKAKAEIEKQKAFVKIEQERSLQRSKQTRQVLISVFMGFILLIVTLFSISLWKRFKIIESQKKLIESQKDLVEEKQKEILDSIHYAKRIQQALLTPEKYIERHISRLKKDT